MSTRRARAPAMSSLISSRAKPLTPPPTSPPPSSPSNNSKSETIKNMIEGTSPLVFPPPSLSCDVSRSRPTLLFDSF